MDSIVTVSVLIFKEDNVLFIKSTQEGGRLKLTLPGGRLGDFENIEECVIREVRESAGITIKLDKKLSGVITRRNRQGNFIATFVFLAETSDRILNSSAVFIPYKDVEFYSDISEFSRLIIDKLKGSTLFGMDRSEMKDTGGREYIMYF